MPTPTEIMNMSASLQNDTAKTVYTDVAQLPYFNMALDDLQEIFEENNVPVTNVVSAVITITAGGTTVTSPSNLIEIQGLYERLAGTTNSFIPIERKEFLTLTTAKISTFGEWAYVGDVITVLPALNNIDVKIEYIKSIFSTPILIAGVGVNIAVKGIKQYLGYRTAALCSRYIGANPTRANELDTDAVMALDRALNIPTKGRQAITTRRKPFRSRSRLSLI